MPPSPTAPPTQPPAGARASRRAGRRNGAASPPLTESVPRPLPDAQPSETGRCVNAGCITDAVLGRRGAAAALAVVGVAGLMTAMIASPASRPPDPLNRPLHLPRLAPGAPCPVSHVDSRVQFVSRFGTGAGLGAGPAYPILPTGVLQLAPAANFSSQSWAGQKVLWLVLPSYRGPVLVRGARLDGNSFVRFGSGSVPPTQLTIPVYTRGGQPGGLRHRPGRATSPRTPACVGPAVMRTRSTAPPLAGSSSFAQCQSSPKTSSRSRAREFSDVT